MMTDSNVCVQEDSGQYQCDPSASYPQHVNVHVIDTGKIFKIGSYEYLWWIETTNGAENQDICAKYSKILPVSFPCFEQ